MTPKHRVFVLHHDLADGVHSCACEDTGLVVSSLMEWMKDAQPGEVITIGCLTMTEAELRNLQDL